MSGDERSGAGRRRYLAVAEEILHAIALGQLAPGDRLPDERALAVRCEVSRPTVREALLALELGGVIEVRRGAGCFVTLPGTRPGPAPALPMDAVPRQILQVRRLLEPAAARSCAAGLVPAQRARLAAVVDAAAEQLAAGATDGTDRFSECNQEFHRQIALGSGNDVLAELIRQLIDPTRHPLWTLVDTLAGRRQEVRASQLAEHRAVLDAVLRGDGDGATEAMAVHLTAMSDRMFGAHVPVHRAGRRTPRRA